jgi:hypothetical protein
LWAFAHTFIVIPSTAIVGVCACNSLNQTSELTRLQGKLLQRQRLQEQTPATAIPLLAFAPTISGFPSLRHCWRLRLQSAGFLPLAIVGVCAYNKLPNSIFSLFCPVLPGLDKIFHT